MDEEERISLALDSRFPAPPAHAADEGVALAGTGRRRQKVARTQEAAPAQGAVSSQAAAQLSLNRSP